MDVFILFDSFLWNFQSRFSYGRSRRGVREPAGSVGHMFPEAVEDGSQLKEAAVLPRRHKFDFFEQRDGLVPASNILQRTDDQNGKLAHSNFKWVNRRDVREPGTRDMKIYIN